MSKISVIVPCYNEEDVLNLFYEELINTLNTIELEYNYEIIFIDDGSKDKTLEILKHLRKQNYNINIISFSRNFGKEAAIYAGLNNCTGDYVVLMDADLQHPPKIILEMLEDITLNGFDVVATKRKNRNGEPALKKLFSKTFYFLMNKFIPMEQGVQDFRMMKKEVVESILSLKEYNRFSKGIFAWIGFNVKYISIENIERHMGKTKWSFKNLFSYAIEGIVSFTTAPLRIATIIGIIISILSIIFAAIIVIQTLAMGKDVPGYASIITSVLFIGGIQLLTIGILSEYISKMYLEIKNRPKYIIKENIQNVDK